MTDATARRRQEELLDDMLADSFPASDPPSFTPVTRVGSCRSNGQPDLPGDGQLDETNRTTVEPRRR